MTRRLAALAILALTSGLRAQEPGGQRSATEQEIRSLQTRVIDAYIHRDLSVLQRALADDYSFVESHGRVLHKADLLQNFGSGDRVLTSYVLDDDRVSIYGDAAVMTYHYRSKEKYRGEDQSGDFRMIRVFARKSGQWQMVAAQETAITAPAK